MAEKTVEQLEAELAVYKSALAKDQMKSGEELDGIVKDENGEIRPDAFENLSMLYSSKVKKIKASEQETWDKSAQKREAQIRNKLEKHIVEVTGYDGEVIDTEDLVVKAFEKATEKQKKSVLTPDDAKKTPEYLALEREFAKHKSESIPKSEHDKFVQEIEKKEKMNSIKSKVLNKFNTFQIEQIENPTVKAKRTDLFLREFDGYDYEMDGDNVIIIKDGKRLEDDHGNLVQFDKFIENTAQEHFVFLKQSPKGSAGNGNPDVKVEPKGEVSIKDEAHYAELMGELDARQAAEKDPAKVIEIRKERAKLGETWMGQGK